MGSSKRIFDGVIWTYISAFLSAIYGFVSVPLLLDYFGKVNYGLIALAMSLNVYLGLMDLGITGTTVRYFSTWLVEGNKEKVKRLFRTAMFFLGCIGIINLIILFFFSYYCESIFDLNVSEARILRCLIAILGVNAFFSWTTSPFDQIIKSGENVAWLQKRSLYPIFCQVLILVLTLVFHWNIIFYFALTTFSYLFIVPVTIRKIKKLYPYISFIPKLDRTILNDIFSYSISIFSFGVFQFSMINLRPIILGMQADVESVADYKVINGIIGMVLTISSCFFGVMLPSSTKAVAEKNLSAINRITYGGTKYVTIVLSLMIFGGVVVGDSLLQLYVGDSFSHLSIWLIIWLITLFVQHNQAISTLIFAGTNVRPIAYMSAFSTLVGLLICWFLSPLLKVGGIVIGYAIYCLLQTFFYYCYYWPSILHIDSKKVFTKSFLPPFAVGLLSAWVVLAIKSQLTLSLYGSFFISGLLYVILYGICIYLFVLGKADKLFFKNLINK